ncbi:melatonin receptor type 1A-like [Stylophora pistillata]|uniref:melatonin receptor type 1A-like n=1 Tax=Stylophora pistillata TaxID=50429 RepID=UPI000C04D4F4|nr:melatonin receptor type 1A-like [Stylophora pistillata]
MSHLRQVFGILHVSIREQLNGRNQLLKIHHPRADIHMKIMNVSNESTPSFSPQPPPGITTFTRTTYSILSVVAMIGNILVILVFVGNKDLLKKSYNILILSLAISDILTALLLITNPAFVLGDAFPYPTNHVIGDIFCRVLWSRAILFQLVVFSAYICLALATERWYAVVKPYKYNEVFSKKRTLVYISLVWLWSFLLCGTSLFEVAYVPTEPLNRRCKWELFLGEQPVRTIGAIIQVLFKMVLPSLTMSCLFFHMVYKAGRSTVVSAESKAQLRGKMTRMVGAACLMLIICYAPNQINYALAMAGKTRLDSELHHGLSILVFVNSCVNPFIYGFSNRNYRNGYLRIVFSACFKISGRRISNRVTDGSYCVVITVESVVESARENSAQREEHSSRE